MRISDWSSDVCSSDLRPAEQRRDVRARPRAGFPDSRGAVEQAHHAFRDDQLCVGPARNGPHLRCGHRPAIEVEGRAAARRLLESGVDIVGAGLERLHPRSEEHTSELQSLMRISYAVFCLKKKK